MSRPSPWAEVSRKSAAGVPGNTDPFGECPAAGQGRGTETERIGLEGEARLCVVCSSATVAQELFGQINELSKSVELLNVVMGLARTANPKRGEHVMERKPLQTVLLIGVLVCVFGMTSCVTTRTKPGPSLPPNQPVGSSSPGEGSGSVPRLRNASVTIGRTRR